MRPFHALTMMVVFMLDCTPQYAQSSVSRVAFSESQDVVPAFSDAGPITLPALRRLIDVSYPNGKNERGELLVLYEPQGGRHLWHFSRGSSVIDTYGYLKSIKSGSIGIYVAPDALVEFQDGSAVIESKTRSTSLGNAESASIDEIQQNLRATAQVRGPSRMKIIPLLDVPPLVGFEKSPSWTKRLTGFTPISPDFKCHAYGPKLPWEEECRPGTLVVSISRQDGNWRLVLRDRWDVEVILDPSFNAVSSRALTAPRKRDLPFHK